MANVKPKAVPPVEDIPTNQGGRSRKPRRPLLPLKAYTRLKLFTGESLGRHQICIWEPNYDEYCAWTATEFAYVARQRFGNEPLMLKCYGGPNTCDTWVLPKLSSAKAPALEGVAERSTILRIQELERRQQELLEENVRLKSTPDPEPLAPAPRDNRGAFDRYLDIAAESLGPLLILKFGTMLGLPIDSIADTMQKTNAPLSPEIADSTDDMIEIAFDDGQTVCIPSPLLDLFGRIDYTRTDYKRLLSMLEANAGFLGISFR